MDETNLTNEEWQHLAQNASRRLGLTPEQMAAAVNEGGLSALSRKLSAQDTKRLNDLLNDPQKAKELMAKPEVQSLIRSLLNKG